MKGKTAHNNNTNDNNDNNQLNLGSFSRLCILTPEKTAWFLAGQSQHSSRRQHKQSRMTDRGDHYSVWGCNVTHYLPPYHDFYADSTQTQ